MRHPLPATLLLLYLGGFLLIVASIIALERSGLSGPVYHVLVVVLVVLFWGHQMYFVRRAVAHFAMARQAVGRCCGCTYELKGLVPDDDGCTVCPECGAAWRLPAGPDGADRARHARVSPRTTEEQ